MKYRLVTPRQGRSRILWNKDAILAPELVEALKEADKIPGVELYPDYIEIPATAYYIEPVEHLQYFFFDETRFPPFPLAMGVQPNWADRKLFTHQLDGVDWAVGSPTGGLLLCDDMGLGKTSTAIAAAETFLEHRQSVAQKVLIIGPAFSREVWRHELLEMGVISNPDEFCAIKTRNIDHVSYNENARYVFMHYDVAWHWQSGIVGVKKFKPGVAIVDEAHWIKNGRAQRSKATQMLASQAHLRIGLTGTPLENRPGDLWHLLTTIVGPNSFGGPLDFRKRYAGAFYSGYGWEDAEEPTHIEELQTRLEDCYLRRTVEQAGIDLPPMTRSNRIVAMRDADRRKHDKIIGSAPIEKLVRAVLEGQIRDVLPILTRLQQATSRGKIASTVELVNDFREQGENVVIFCQEREVVELLAERTKARFATGQYSIDHRVKVIEGFQRAGGTLVATYGALKEGVTLHKSRIVVMHDLNWVLSALLQAERRIHRIGQKRACQSIWVLGESSFDVVLADALLTKAKIAEEILGIKEGVEATAEVNLKTLVGAEDFEKRTARMLDDWEASL
jgi:SWI/SNF-related matrix-associated actin-dependent regulator 1 of chromatin subfamily A